MAVVHLTEEDFKLAEAKKNAMPSLIELFQKNMDVLVHLPRVQWDIFPSSSQQSKKILMDELYDNHPEAADEKQQVYTSMNLHDVQIPPINKQTDIMVSTPVDQLFAESYIQGANVLSQNVMCFYGYQDGREFDIYTRGQNIRVSGHFPLFLNMRYFIRVTLPNPSDGRCLVRYTHDPKKYETYQEYRNLYFVWHKDHSTVFETKQEADQFISQTNRHVTVLQHAQGIFEAYHLAE